MSEAGAKLLRRHKAALSKRQAWDSLLRDAFSLAAPNADSGFTSASRGQARTAEIYDATAVLAVRDAARASYSTITPPQSRFFRLALSEAAAEAVEGSGLEQQIDDALEAATDTWFSHFNASNYALVAEQAFISGEISAGVLLLNEDTRSRTASAFVFQPVSLAELAMSPGLGTSIGAVYQQMRLPADQIEATWPGIRLTDDIREMAGKDVPPEVDLVVATEIDHDTGRADYSVIDVKTEDVLIEREYRRSPWIVFRPSVAPGEVLGRGPVLDVLPDIRTLNKAVELVLKNASIAMSGIWQADDDGVINLANINLRPGAIIPKAVGSNGLQPLRTGADFSVSELVLGDLRRRIRDTVFGPEFPPLAESHAMTATETERRVQQHNLLQTPARLRVWREMVVSMVARGMEILDRRGELPPVLGEGLFRDIGAGYVDVIPLSPVAQAQDIDQIMRANAALGLIAQIDPAGIGAIADLTGYQAWALERAGFPAQFIRDERDRRDMLAQQAEAAAAQQVGQALPDVAKTIASLAQASKVADDGNS